MTSLLWWESNFVLNNEFCVRLLFTASGVLGVDNDEQNSFLSVNWRDGKLFTFGLRGGVGGLFFFDAFIWSKVKNKTYYINAMI